jgi:hypothetical protein
VNLAPPELRRSATLPGAEEIVLPPEGQRRDVALKQWLQRMPPPKPGTKELDGELKSWAGTVGKRKWVAERYGPTAALLLRSRSVDSADPEQWAAVFVACAELIEPLSRYTAGWSDSVHTTQPQGLPARISTPLREIARRVPKAVRVSMARENADAVIATADSADDFIDHPHRRHPQDARTAVLTYGVKVRALLTSGLPGSRDVRERAAERIRDHLAALLSELDVDLPPEPTGAERTAADQEAFRFLDRIVATKFANLNEADPRYEHFAEAHTSLLTTYRNRLLAGLSLEGTENYIHLRLRSVKIDTWRRKSREGPHENLDRGATNAAAVSDPVPTESNAHVEQVRRAARSIAADPTLRTPAGEPYWEARTAAGILLGAIALNVDDLKNEIAAIWDEQAPVDSRSRSAGQAAQDVRLIMKAALERTEDDDRQDPS